MTIAAIIVYDYFELKNLNVEVEQEISEML